LIVLNLNLKQIYKNYFKNKGAVYGFVILLEQVVYLNV